MKKILTKVALPAMLAVSTLGIGAVVATVPASAVTAKAPVTLKGTVTKAQASKSTFWFSVGTKSYRVSYSSMTKFTTLTSASLVKGKSVSVTGTYVGKSTSVIKATSIS